MKTAIYVRVSSEEQKLHGVSIDNQLDALQQFCRENHHTIVDTYNDAGISARKRFTKRPELLRLLADVEQGKVEQIIFTKIDRWFRNLADYYEVQRILEEHQVVWQAIWEDYETITPSGRLKLNIMLSISQDEADRTGERVRAAKAYQMAQGKYMGKAPVGYVVKKGILSVDPATQPAVQRIFEVYLETKSINQTLDTAKLCGIMADKRMLLRMLRNPQYYGGNGQYSCPAYITPAQHEEIVASIRTDCYDRNAIKEHIYLFSGIIRCAKCGGRMSSCSTAYNRADGTRARKHTYRCVNASFAHSCPGISITESVLEELMLSQMDRMLEAIAADYRQDRKQKQDTAQQKKRLEQRIERAKTLYLDGDIDYSDYQKRRQDAQDALAALSAEQCYTPVQLPSGWSVTYANLSQQDKKAFWRTAVQTVFVDSGHLITIRLK